MKRKIFFIIGIIIFLSGCTTNFNLTINEDLSNELEIDLKIKKNELIIGEPNATFDLNGYFNKVGNDTINKYKEQYPYFSYKTNMDNDYIYGSAIISNKSINDLLKSNFITDMYETSSFTIEDNIGTLKLFNVKQDWYINNIDTIDTLNINIKLPLVVTYSNATSIKNNIYTWNIMNNDDILIKFNVNKTNEQLEKDEEKKRVWIIIIGSFLIVSLIIGFIVINNKEKK